MPESDPRDIRVGDYVRLGGGSKVYRVVAVEVMPRRGHDGMVKQFKIDATADHSQAATRVQDALAWYVEEELTKVVADV